MSRIFNITGSCSPKRHYMVDLTSRLEQIKKLIDNGDYFTINRGRQHGKTTTLKALEEYLSDEYIVISLDFQRQMSNAKFADESVFSKAFAEAIIDALEFSKHSDKVEIAEKHFCELSDLVDLFRKISRFCRDIDAPIVLLIDEVDSASNNQVFLDFLAQLRGYYLERDNRPTFRSVILAGVHDIRNIRQKIRPEEAHKHNSPWNIAAEFNVDMSFNVNDISGMLNNYENDHNSGMDVQKTAQLIYDYTSGYPVLVSTLCKYMDEEFGWDNEGFLNAVSKLISQPTPLFESLINKLEVNPDLKELVRNILFDGRKYIYNKLDPVLNTAAMYGFVTQNGNNGTAISNRIFETVIYDWFISLEKTSSSTYSAGENDKSQFILNGRLDMERILEKFAVHFNDIYGSQPDKFKEEEGRKLFLLYLRPIINGTGNYYIEAQTRDQKRTDIIVDYLGKQYIVELKIWRGDEYNNRGEQQLSEYLDYYHADEGYLLSFNFNKNKQTGVQKINVNGKTIIEAVV